MKCRMRIGILVLALTTLANSNVGGVFHFKGLSGLKIDSLGVIDATTKLDCRTMPCRFETTYRTNVTGASFSGGFYGARIDSLYLNDTTLLTRHDSIGKDSVLFGARWVLSDFDRTGIVRYPFATSIGLDSIMRISGRIHSDSSVFWGIATAGASSSIRHLGFIGSKHTRAPSYSVGYILAPIDSFTSLKTVQVDWNFDSTYKVLRLIHYAHPKRLTACEKSPRISFCVDSLTKASEDSGFRSAVYSEYRDTVPSQGRLVLDRSFPSAVEFQFALDQPMRFPQFHLGGPLVQLGNNAGRFTASAGWEAALDLTPSICVLPAAMIGYSREEVYPEEWLRLSYNFANIGIGMIGVDDWTWRVGLDLPAVWGIEFNHRSVFFKVSL